MQVLQLSVLWALLLYLITRVNSVVRLGPLLVSLKNGPFAETVGPGGLLALAIAGSEKELGGGISRRTARSVQHAAHTPFLLNGTASERESETIQAITATLNNVSSPVTQRLARQVAILDQLSCLPKLICAVNTREPSRKTSVINDYGFLIKYLFERDDEDDPQEDDEEDDDEPLGRKEETDLTKKTKEQATKGTNNEDEDEDASDSAEEFLAEVDDDEPSMVRSALKEDKLEDEAQDKLLEDEPELLMYAMAEMRDQYKKKRIPGINKNYGLDHSDAGPYPVPGYSKDDYKIIPNPLLNTDSASNILKERSKYTFTTTKGGPSDAKGWNIGKKKVNFEVDEASEESQSFLGSLMPSFLVQKKKVTVSQPRPDDPFAGDPFFEDFKRRSLSVRRGRSTDDKYGDDIRDEFVVHRRNSRLTNPLNFMKRKSEAEDASDTLRRYERAEEVGRQTKNNRQCRMLFAKCPYSQDEISSMIDSVKNLVTTQKTAGDKVVSLKKTDGSSSGTTGSSSVSLSPKSSSSSASIEIPSAGGGGGGITQISHQLDNGDKVEITLNIKPKGDSQVVRVVQVPVTPDPELVKANKTLHDMRLALQAIARLHNQTELQHVQRKKEQSLKELLQLELSQHEAAQKSRPVASSLPDSAESGSDSKSSEVVAKRPQSVFTKDQEHTEVLLSTTARPDKSHAQNDDAEDEEDDDEDDEEGEDEDEEEEEEEEEDDPRNERPANKDHLHFYRNQPVAPAVVPTQPPTKTRFGLPYIFGNVFQDRQPTRPNHHHPQGPAIITHPHRIPPRIPNDRNTGPVYINHVPEPPPKRRTTLKSKAEAVKRRSSVPKSSGTRNKNRSDPPKSKSKAALATVSKSKIKKGNSTSTTTRRPEKLRTTTLKPEKSSPAVKSDSVRPKPPKRIQYKRPQPKPATSTESRRPSQPKPTTKPKQTTEALPQTSKIGQTTMTEIPNTTQTTVFLELNPMLLPTSTRRPDRVTSTRPPSQQLPPRPSKYKIQRKKGAKNSSHESVSNSRLTKRRN